MDDLKSAGFVLFDTDQRVGRWARQARTAAKVALVDEALRQQWLRHGGTWFVGVDVLPNQPDGSINGVPFVGPWEHKVGPIEYWHPGQLSVVYEGFPGHDPGESDASHRYRVQRDGAHVDGLYLEAGRRIVREPHGFILGVPLTEAHGCPLVVWRRSHMIIRAGLREVIGREEPIGVDVTDAYKAARQACFEVCDRVEIMMRPGQAVLLHPLALHGIAPWKPGQMMPELGRQVAYFRPHVQNARDWLSG